jgi:hypothetical protein
MRPNHHATGTQLHAAPELQVTPEMISVAQQLKLARRKQATAPALMVATVREWMNIGAGGMLGEATGSLAVRRGKPVGARSMPPRIRAR